MMNLNESYLGARPEVQRLVPPTSRRILDVGCAAGALGAALKARSGATVVGIELDPVMADLAREHLDDVVNADALQALTGSEIGDLPFDAIILADVLEHTADPWRTLQMVASRLSHGGVVIASLPNIRHLDTIYNLVVRGHWPYRDRGIHDRTHLRFFTWTNVIELFHSAGLRIEVREVNYRLIERPHRINAYAHYFAWPGVREFLAFQYVVRAVRA